MKHYRRLYQNLQHYNLSKFLFSFRNFLKQPRLEECSHELGRRFQHKAALCMNDDWPISVLGLGTSIFADCLKLQTTRGPPFLLRDTRVSRTQGGVKITPRQKRQHVAGREKNEGLQTKPKLLNLCIALTMQNSDWLFHGNLSTSVKNMPADINTRHNHNLQNK